MRKEIRALLQGNLRVPEPKPSSAITRLKMSEAHKGQIPWNKGLPSPFKGKTYEEIGRDQSPLLGRPRTEEDKQRISKSHLKRLGREVPVIARDNGPYNRWRTAVKKRDNYTCQECGITQKEIKKVGISTKDYLHAHHIKPWQEHTELRFDITNGITYCWECHLKAENKQITTPESMPALLVKKKVAWNKGKTLTELYEKEKADLIRRKLSESHKGLISATKGKPFTSEHKRKLSEAKKGKFAWNKGKTNIEIMGLERATKLSKIQADNAQRTKNRLGTGKKIA